MVIDNYDSFTYILVDYLRQLGADCRVFRNDAISLRDAVAFPCHGIVLSPGPKAPEDAGILMDLIAARHATTPLLGICLGHQAIGEYFGALLRRADEPRHGKTSTIEVTDHPLWIGLPRRFNVMRYHSLLLDNLTNTDLLPLAYSDAGELMALAHHTYPCWGVQFHPESILTEHGLAMLRNWLMTLPAVKLRAG